MTELFLIDGVETHEKPTLCVLKIPFTGNETYNLLAKFLNENSRELLGVKRIEF